MSRPALRYLGVALLATLLLTGCGGRSPEEQKMYDLGYRYADAMITKLGITDDDAIYDGCGLLAQKKGLAPKSDLSNALGDGCWDRIHK